MSKDKYKVKNWSAYNEGLKQRGSLCLWIETDIADHWKAQASTKKRGGQTQYSDTAIEICLTIRKLYHLGIAADRRFYVQFFQAVKSGYTGAGFYGTVQAKQEVRG